MVRVIPISVKKVDVLYLTRLQKERYRNEFETIPSNECCTLFPEVLEEAKPHLKVMHPLPHGSELPSEIDKTPHAHYFQQAANGLPLRQALIRLLLHKD